MLRVLLFRLTRAHGHPLNLTIEYTGQCMLATHVPTGGGFSKFPHNLSNSPSPSRPQYTAQRIPVTPAMDWHPSIRPPGFGHLFPLD